jgi:hypothetical protein
VGDILAGGLGAMVGGLSANKTTGKGKVTRLALKIIVNDTAQPVFWLMFIDSPQDRGPIYRQFRSMAEHWHAMISVLIRRADQEQLRQASSSKQIAQTDSIADELTKLSALLEKGLLTTAEFMSEKRKLLDRRVAEPVIEAVLDDNALDIRRRK